MRDQNQHPSPQERPRSATSVWINWIGVASFLATAYLLRLDTLVSNTFSPALVSPLAGTILLALSFFFPVAILEYVFLRTYRRSSTGINWKAVANANWSRIFVKLVGLWTTLLVIGLCYYIFPHYQDDLYQPYWAAIGWILPFFLLLSPLYFLWIDPKMSRPYDNYWNMGALVLGHTDKVHIGKIKQHAFGWAIKGFFLPLMFSYLHGNLEGLRNRPPIESLDFMGWYYLLYDILILVDVGCIVVGYTLTVRALDSHIRSAESTWGGWISALMCYQPFWGLIGPSYFAYRDEQSWLTIFEGYPIIQGIFAALILGFMGVYTWASMSFGLRFSNLTNRGVITNGPYRFTKHPAYVFKNTSWWLESLPFLTPLIIGLRTGMWRGWWGHAALNCIRLAGVNVIYYLRARTEERHMSKDPHYVRYALWMNAHGTFAWVGRILPFMRYKPPQWYIEHGPDGAPDPAGPPTGRLGDGPPAHPQPPSERAADADWDQLAQTAERESEPSRKQGRK